MSTEAQRKFTLVGAHRQLHADAAKELAKLEYLISESNDPDEIVVQSRNLAIANAAVDIFEIHMDRHHPLPEPSLGPGPTPQNSPGLEATATNSQEGRDKQEMLDKIKKLTEARGSVPLAAPHSLRNRAPSVRKQNKNVKKERNSGNTDKKKDLYGETT